MSISRINQAVGSFSTGTNVASITTGTVAGSGSGTFPTSAGDCIAVFVVWGSTSITVTSVTDVAGNTYTAQTSCPRSDGFSSGQWWVAKNVTGNAANAATANFSSTVAYVAIHALEYSGVDTSSPVDVNPAAGAGSGATLTSASFTTTSANEVLLVGGNAASYITFTAGGSYTIQTQDSATPTGPISATEDLIVTSTQSSVTASMTQSGTGAWLIAVLSLKAAVAANTDPPFCANVGLPQSYLPMIVVY